MWAGPGACMGTATASANPLHDPSRRVGADDAPNFLEEVLKDPLDYGPQDLGSGPYKCQWLQASNEGFWAPKGVQRGPKGFPAKTCSHIPHN